MNIKFGSEETVKTQIAEATNNNAIIQEWFAKEWADDLANRELPAQEVTAYLIKKIESSCAKEYVRQIAKGYFRDLVIAFCGGFREAQDEMINFWNAAYSLVPVE